MFKVSFDEERVTLTCNNVTIKFQLSDEIVCSTKTLACAPHARGALTIGTIEDTILISALAAGVTYLEVKFENTEETADSLSKCLRTIRAARDLHLDLMEQERADQEDFNLP